ncbi:MAG: tetratricopeptide repeat protein [Pyrinomonadaceae bacterium]|nr:tetratricopeptide repeat protein [Pyrinomonadaceae bacterium]
MKTLQAIVLALFVFAVGALAQAPADNRISATWQVTRYDINAAVPASETDRNLSATAVLQLLNVSGRPATSLTLRISPNANVAAVRINDSQADFTKAQEKLGSSDLQIIRIRVPSVAAGGNLNAAVEYKLAVPDNTGLASITAGGSQFLPLSFWYPTPNSWFFARGADYAPARLQINGGGRTVISAGSETGGAFDNKLYGQPFFLAGTWDRVDTGGVPVYLTKGLGPDAQKRAAEVAAFVTEARSFVEGLLGKGPDAPLRIVSVRRGAGYGSGGTLLVEDGLFRRSKIDSVSALALAEAVVRLWFGDSAMVTDDGAGVIREGLARYIATQFIETKYGKDVAEVERLRHRNAYTAISRRDSALGSVAPLDDFYFAAVANKGAMFWRLLERKIGRDEFYSTLRSQLEDRRVTLADLRAAYSSQSAFITSMLDQVTDINLQAGLPQAAGGDWKVALRNTGQFDVTVNVAATQANGERLSAPTTIKAGSFGEVVFKTPQRITSVEIDPEKLYPQIDYSDDRAPRETTDSDLLLAVKRDFDRQQYAAAEKTAREVLKLYPRFDDVRVLLARSLLGLGRLNEAESEFRAVIDEKLPTARSLSWANVGLAEVASRTNRGPDAIRFATDAIKGEAEYGASLLARTIRNRHDAASGADESIKSFFTRFDAAAISNRKAELDALAVPGDVNRFISGVSGQTTQWNTSVLHADALDADSVLVEASLTVKLLNREPETGPAVFRLVRSGGTWKLSGVEIFEVR